MEFETFLSPTVHDSKWDTMWATVANYRWDAAVWLQLEHTQTKTVVSRVV